MEDKNAQSFGQKWRSRFVPPDLGSTNIDKGTVNRQILDITLPRLLDLVVLELPIL